MKHEYNTKYTGSGILHYENKELIKIKKISLEFQEKTTKIEGKIIDGQFNISERNELNKKQLNEDNTTIFFEYMPPNAIMTIKINETNETIKIAIHSLKNIKYKIEPLVNNKFEGELIQQ